MKAGISVLVLLVLSLVLMMGLSSEAHLRDYVVNYGYWTTPQGAFEIEYYSDYDVDKSKLKSWKQQIEVEYGITDSLMMSLYGVFKQSPTKPLYYDSTKLEMRYRFGEYEQFVVDPALYLEYVQASDSATNSKIEAKLILSKDVGAWNFVSNLKFYEREIAANATTEFGYTLGTAYAASDKVTWGLELKGSLGDETSFGLMGGNKHYILPGAYITMADNVRLNLGAGFGLTEASDDFSFKSIIEVEL